MNLVTIKNGLIRNTIINGNFQSQTKFAAQSWAGRPRDGKVTIVYKGKPVGCWVNKKDAVFFNGTKDDITPDAPAPIGRIDREQAQLAAQILDPVKAAANIEERFNVMDRLSTGVIEGKIKGLIIAGAPGVGKSFELENKLERALGSSKIKNYYKVCGAISGRGLYELLFNYQRAGDVVVLDDADRIFGEEDALNVLKAALDTGAKRRISWHTAGGFGKSDIPDSFEYLGSIVFLSNMNFDTMSQGTSRIAPHIAALLSRSLYLDLGVHTLEEIMIRIEQVVAKGDVLQHKNLTKGQKVEILDFIRANYKKFRRLSIREMLHLADLMDSSPKTWKKDAEATMFDPRKVNA